MVLAEKGVVDFSLYTPDMMAGEHKVRIIAPSITVTVHGNTKQRLLQETTNYR